LGYNFPVQLFLTTCDIDPHFVSVVLESVTWMNAAAAATTTKTTSKNFILLGL
jgi:hypothetical protein